MSRRELAAAGGAIAEVASVAFTDVAATAFQTRGVRVAHIWIVLARRLWRAGVAVADIVLFASAVVLQRELVSDTVGVRATDVGDVTGLPLW